MVIFLCVKSCGRIAALNWPCNIISRSTCSWTTIFFNINWKIAKPFVFLVSNWKAKNKTNTCSFFFSSDMRQVTRGIASFNLRYMSNSRRFKRAHETLRGWMSFSWEPKKWQVLTLLFVCFFLCFRWRIWSTWKSSCLPRPRGEQWNKWTVQFFVITLNSYLLQI